MPFIIIGFSLLVDHEPSYRGLGFSNYVVQDRALSFSKIHWKNLHDFHVTTTMNLQFVEEITYDVEEWF